MNPYEKLWNAIQAKAQELGLVFVDGPNPTAMDPANYRPTQPDYYQASGQSRAGFSFSVVET
jgi:hypothetical protein